jgi:hypothetical protein
VRLGPLDWQSLTGNLSAAAMKHHEALDNRSSEWRRIRKDPDSCVGNFNANGGDMG